ncbi:MAG: RidA family protein [Clostridiales bacterium]|jgi:2-iminobutanoate/2-iminopropanoate deaminase|nr:RidA family protein [Clostridiales bacterium]
MERRIIETKNAPAAIGPYSQGIAAGGLVFFSGQIAIDPRSGETVSGGVTEQARRVLKNIAALLESQNMTAQNVVKTTVYLTDMNDFAALNAVYAEFFGVNPPARSCVGVASLPKGALVEIEITAAK